MISLVHSSWRSPKHDAEKRFEGKKMYRFDAVIDAPDNILEQIEEVKYLLHPSYPNPVQTVSDRSNRFKLKELAYGSTELRAEVKMRNRKEPVILSRFITLRETSPRI
jgi:transcription initiation factor IIF auxiliary subunit